MITGCGGAAAKSMNDNMARCSELIAEYERGRSTRNETLLRLIPALADSGEFPASLPGNWPQIVFNELASAPKSDSEWTKMRVFHTGAWSTTDAYAESIRRNELLLAQYRRGVEELRLQLADRG